jgi:hypothetical protein
MTMFFPSSPDIPPDYTQPGIYHPPQQHVSMPGYPPLYYWQPPLSYYPPPMPQQGRLVNESMKFAAIVTWVAALVCGLLAGIVGGFVFTGIGFILSLASFVCLCMI